MSLEELTKNFKPVKNEDTSIFKEYYPSFFKARKYPRFYQSLMEMSQYVNVPTYFWKEINNCLVVLHKRWIHQPVMYLALPPINRNKKIEDELKVIQDFQKAGIMTRLSKEDLNVLNIPESETNKIPNNFEFIYNSSDIQKMEGRKWRNFRYKVNKYLSLKNEGTIKIEAMKKLDFLTYQKLEASYQKWLKHKKKKTMHSGHKVLLNHQKGLSVLILLVHNHDNLLGWGISEKISDKKVIQTTRFRNYESQTLVDPSIIIHYEECKSWSSEGTLLNFGSGVVKDLIEHKSRLKPAHLLQLYDLKTEKKVDKETWRNCCKNKLGFGII